MDKKDLYPLYIGAAITVLFPLAAHAADAASLWVLAICYGIFLMTGLYLGYRYWLWRFEEKSAKDVSHTKNVLVQAYEQGGEGWFWQTDRRGNLVYISPSVVERLGQTAKNLSGVPFVSLVSQYGSDGSKEDQRTLGFHLSSQTPFANLQLRVKSEDDRWWKISGVPQVDSLGNFAGFCGTGTDLTEMKRSQEVVTQLARYDPLTKLANRASMSEALDRALKGRNGQPGDCAVMLLDLDKFKQVNDTMGHPTGDALLQEVATRLTAIVGTMGQVGRLGGDEFQIIFPNLTSEQQLRQIADDIITKISKPYRLKLGEVRIGVSIGIMIVYHEAIDAATVIRNADLALYEAKDAGRGVARIYHDKLLEKAKERSELEQDLRSALTQGQLFLVYQPVIAVSSERITGFEVLIRWQHPRLGLISPDIFIGIAEECGLIDMIGDWTLRTACAQLAAWGGDLKMAVNVSPVQFRSGNLTSIVTHAIAQNAINPQQLELEITESVFLDGDEANVTTFNQLKKLGVRLALDDFGTGYSALGYLQKAPFDKIKIDQSFVRGATLKNSINAAIISSIVSLANALGMDTTAEGAETHDELQLVRQLGCSHVQGYIYGKPMSASEASALLRTQFGVVEAQGYESNREKRRKMYQKVGVHHEGYCYSATLKNLSPGGAMIDGLFDVPNGTEFLIEFANGMLIEATSRWSDENLTGMQFHRDIDIEKIRKLVDTPIQPGWRKDVRPRTRVRTH